MTSKYFNISGNENVLTKISYRFPALPFEAKTTLVLTVAVILFHILDKQIEFTSRTDFLWKAKLKYEQEEVETMRGINKVCWCCLFE